MMTEGATPTIGGVPAGGFQQEYEVRILICYLLNLLTHPITREQLDRVIEQYQLANYFVCAAAVAGLLEQNQVKKLEQNGVCYLEILPLGRETATVMGAGISPAVRDHLTCLAKQLSQEHAESGGSYA